MAVTEEIQEKTVEEATSATPTFSVDMNDQQFKDVDAAMKDRENELDNTYAGLIGGADQYYKDLANQSQQWADKQVQIQQDNTDFAIEKIEQQKEQAHKDYLKEQSGAYVDWQKQSNAYGVNAEKMASAGLTNSGYSESSQVSMYNAYQNRVATAREVMAQAKLAYDNNINEAILQNNAAIAEIYANTYKEQLELALQSYLNNQELVLDLANKKQELDNIKWNRYQDVYNRLFGEAQMAEDIRQYNETMKWNTEQKELDRQHESAEKQLDRELESKQAELDRDLDREIEKAKNAHEKEMAKINHDNKVAQMQAEYLYQKALLTQEYDLKKQSVGTVSGNSSGSSGSNTKVSYQTITGKQKQTSSQPPVNMQSVIDLGYGGAISATELAELVASGKVESYVKNGQTYYRRVLARPVTKMETLNNTLTSKHGTTTGKSVSSSSTTKKSNTTYVPLLKGNSFK